MIPSVGENRGSELRCEIGSPGVLKENGLLERRACVVPGKAEILISAIYQRLSDCGGARRAPAFQPY